MILIAHALMTATPPLARGFSTRDMESAARTTIDPDLAEAREKRAEADTLRAAFVLDPTAAAAVLSEDERVVLDTAFGPPTQLRDAELRWFMRSASVRVTPGSKGMSGLYNPIADVWLLLDWSRVGGSWRLIEAALVPGAELRPEPESASWRDAPGLYTVALANAKALAAARFDQLPEVTANKDLFAALAARRRTLQRRSFERIDAMLGSVGTWIRDPAHSWAALRREVVEGKAAPTMSSLPLPIVVRASLTPAAAIMRPDGASLLLVSPLDPDIVVTADFADTSSTGRATLGLINLGNAILPAENSGWPRMKRPAFATALAGADDAGGVQDVPAPLPLVAVAGAARYQMAAATPIMLDRLDPASRAVLSEALGASDRSPGPLWSRLMTGAVQMRREAADTAQTLWFNPVLDGGFVVRWRRGGNGWTAIAAAPVLGQRIRNQSNGADPSVAWPSVAWPSVAWIDSGGSLPDALFASARRSFAAAEAESWDRLFEPGGGDEPVLLARALSAERGLHDMARAPGYSQSLGLLHRLLVTDDPWLRKLPAQMRDGLTDMGEEARATLRPVTAIRRADGWTVVLQSPDAPAIAWLAHFVDPPAGEPALPARFNVVGLGSRTAETRP